MSADPKLVSVAMASYNGARYIAEQLESIVQQTYPNIEIVIVDDHSKDDTVAIIRSYQTKYPFICLIENEENLGVTRTFEKAIVNCKGDFIALSDQDDIWNLQKIDILVNEIGEHDAVYADSLLVNEKGESLGKSFSDFMNIRSYYSGTPFLLSNSVAGHAMLMKTGFVKGILPFPEKIFFDLWIGFCAAGNNGIKFVDKTLVKYRQHDSNTVGTKKSTNKKKKETPQEQFDFKLMELQTLAKAPIKDEGTKKILQEMISHFHRTWSFKRSAFFFRNYEEVLGSKKKPGYRKKMYCLKMFFKPNF
jgi:glycosyltransferase involved in cell wall biosynthesis